MQVADHALAREATFDVTRDYVPPDLRALVGGTERLPERRLHTVYLDTPDRRLRRLGVSLSHECERRPDDDRARAGTWSLRPSCAEHAQTLDRPGLTWAGSRDEVPAEARALLRGVVRRSELRPLIELDTDRRRLRLYLPGRTAVLGQVDDDLVRVSGGPRHGLCFRQIKVDVFAPRAPEADLVLRRLRRSGAKPSDRSPLALALEGSGGGEAGRSHTGKSTAKRKRTRQNRAGECCTGTARRRQTLRETIGLTLEAGLDRLLVHDCRLRLRAHWPDPEDVHQTRVAARRLRSTLKTFEPVLDPVWLRHMREDLSWLGGVLGRLRDIDILSDHLAQQGAELRTPVTEVDALRAELDAERDVASAEMREALGSERYLNLLDRLSAARRSVPVLMGAALEPGIGFGPDTKALRALPKLVGAEWRRLRRQVRKAGSHPDDATLHRIRIRAKRLRYAAEAASPICGKPARRTASRAEAIQEVLGELHDATTAELWLREQAARLPPTATFAAGMLCREQQLRRERLRPRWRRKWAALDRTSVLGWLRR